MTDKAGGTQPEPGTGSNAGGTQPEPGQGSDAGTGNQYTDDDIAGLKRRWAKQRDKDVGKAASKAVDSLLGDLGFDDVDDLRSAIEGKRKQDGDEANTASELKRAQRQLAKTAGERDAFASQLGELRGKVNASRVKDAVFAAAKKHQAYEDEVFALVMVQGQVAVDDDGDVFVKGADGEPVHGVSVEKLVGQLVADRQHLQRATGGQGGGSQAATSSVNTKSKHDLLTSQGMAAAAVEQLRAQGKLP
jgi:hypothetical protein